MLGRHVHATGGVPLLWIENRINVASALEGILLSYFDVIIGPNAYRAVPLIEDDSNELTPEKLKEASKLMDDFDEEGFYTFGFKDFESANYFFKIPSPWARGQQETLCLSLLTRTKNPEFFKDALERGANQLREIPDLYKAFHSEKVEEDDSVQKIKDLVDDFLTQLSGDLQKVKEFDLTGKILVIGLDQAGKTSIINYLVNETPSEPETPTIGVNIVKVALSEAEFLVYDCGGQNHLREKWLTTLSAPHALIFVVDLSESGERTEEAKSEFWRVIHHFASYNQAEFPILVLGNKLDLVKATIKEVKAALDLDRIKGRPLKIALTSAKTGVGIEPAFKWLVTQLIKDY
jgi:small GTP-binding protein